MSNLVGYMIGWMIMAAVAPAMFEISNSNQVVLSNIERYPRFFSFRLTYGKYVILGRQRIMVIKTGECKTLKELGFTTMRLK